MSTLNRLLGMASKALGDSGSSTRSSGSTGTAGSSGSAGTDWRDLVRTAADRITGDSRESATPRPAAGTASATPGAAATLSAADRQAIARYDYLVQTAEPHQLERIHEQAFARLTPAQRAEVATRLRDGLPVGERPRSDSSDDLARAATRGEMTRPGSIRSLLGSARGRGIGGAVAGAGVGLAAGGLLATVAGGAVLSSVAAPLLEQAAGLGVDFDALAGDLDLGAITGVDELTSGLGEQISGFGDHISGLGDLFGR